MSEEALETFVEPTQLQDDTSFTEATLDDNMILQSSLLAHYGQQSAKAQHQVDRMKHRLEITEAKSAKALRDEAAEEGKKITEKALEQELALTPAVVRAKRMLNEAKMIAETIKTAVEAIRHKRDMMIQIAAQRRSEFEYSGRITSKVEGAEEAARVNKATAVERAKAAASKQ